MNSNTPAQDEHLPDWKLDSMELYYRDKGHRIGPP